MLNQQQLLNKDQCLIHKAVIILASCLMLAMSSCTELQNKNTALTSNTRLTPQAQTIYLQLLFNSAMYQDDPDTALFAAKELIDTAPSPEILKEAATMFMFAEQQQQALEATALGIQLFPEDLTLHMMLADLLARNEMVKEGIVIIKNYIDNYSSHSAAKDFETQKNELLEARYMLLRMLIYQKEYTDAESMISALSVQDKTPEIRMLEVHILQETNKHNKAHAKLKEITKLYPQYAEAWLSLASDAQNSKNNKLATYYYKKALTHNDSPLIFFYLVQSMISNGEGRQASRMVIESDYELETKLNIAQLFMEHNYYREASEILLSMQDEPAAVHGVNYYLGMISYDTGNNFEASISRLQNLPADPGMQSRMLHLRILLCIKAKDFQQAVDSAIEFQKNFPEQRESWFLLAELYNHVSNYKNAEAVARNALELWPDDTDFMYTLGLSLGYQKKEDAAMLIMEEIVQLDPNNAVALNYLGYTLAERNEELERALELISKAMELEPNNKHITDSLAWVYFKLGRNQEAWKAITKCIKLGADDATIWEHYGDIAQSLKYNKEAKKAYNRALLLKPDNQDLIVQKLKELK